MYSAALEALPSTRLDQEDGKDTIYSWILRRANHPWLHKFYLVQPSNRSQRFDLIHDIRKAYTRGDIQREDGMLKTLIEEKIYWKRERRTESGKFSDKGVFIGEVLVAWALCLDNPSSKYHSYAKQLFGDNVLKKPTYPWQHLRTALLRRLTYVVTSLVSLWKEQHNAMEKLWKPNKPVVVPDVRRSTVTPDRHTKIEIVDLTNDEYDCVYFLGDEAEVQKEKEKEQKQQKEQGKQSMVTTPSQSGKEESGMMETLQTTPIPDSLYINDKLTLSNKHLDCLYQLCSLAGTDTSEEALKILMLGSEMTDDIAHELM